MPNDMEKSVFVISCTAKYLVDPTKPHQLTSKTTYAEATVVDFNEERFLLTTAAAVALGKGSLTLTIGEKTIKIEPDRVYFCGDRSLAAINIADVGLEQTQLEPLTVAEKFPESGAQVTLWGFSHKQTQQTYFPPKAEIYACREPERPLKLVAEKGDYASGNKYLTSYSGRKVWAGMVHIDTDHCLGVGTPVVSSEEKRLVGMVLRLNADNMKNKRFPIIHPSVILGFLALVGQQAHPGEVPHIPEIPLYLGHDVLLRHGQEQDQEPFLDSRKEIVIEHVNDEYFEAGSRLPKPGATLVAIDGYPIYEKLQLLIGTQLLPITVYLSRLASEIHSCQVTTRTFSDGKSETFKIPLVRNTRSIAYCERFKPAVSSFLVVGGLVLAPVYENPFKFRRKRGNPDFRNQQLLQIVDVLDRTLSQSYIPFIGWYVEALRIPDAQKQEREPFVLGNLSELAKCYDRLPMGASFILNVYEAVERDLHYDGNTTSITGFQSRERVHEDSFAYEPARAVIVLKKMTEEESDELLTKHGFSGDRSSDIPSPDSSAPEDRNYFIVEQGLAQEQLSSAPDADVIEMEQQPLPAAVEPSALDKSAIVALFALSHFPSPDDSYSRVRSYGITGTGILVKREDNRLIVITALPLVTTGVKTVFLILQAGEQKVEILLSESNIVVDPSIDAAYITIPEQYYQEIAVCNPAVLNEIPFPEHHELGMFQVKSLNHVGAQNKLVREDVAVEVMDKTCSYTGITAWETSNTNRIPVGNISHSNVGECRGSVIYDSKGNFVGLVVDFKQYKEGNTATFIPVRLLNDSLHYGERNGIFSSPSESKGIRQMYSRANAPTFQTQTTSHPWQRQYYARQGVLITSGEYKGCLLNGISCDDITFAVSNKGTVRASELSSEHIPWQTVFTLFPRAAKVRLTFFDPCRSTSTEVEMLLDAREQPIADLGFVSPSVTLGGIFVIEDVTSELFRCIDTGINKQHEKQPIPPFATPLLSACFHQSKLLSNTRFSTETLSVSAVLPRSFVWDTTSYRKNHLVSVNGEQVTSLGELAEITEAPALIELRKSVYAPVHYLRIYPANYPPLLDSVPVTDTLSPSVKHQSSIVLIRKYFEKGDGFFGKNPELPFLKSIYSYSVQSNATASVIEVNGELCLLTNAHVANNVTALQVGLVPESTSVITTEMMLNRTFVLQCDTSSVHACFHTDLAVIRIPQDSAVLPYLRPLALAAQSPQEASCTIAGFPRSEEDNLVTLFTTCRLALSPGIVGVVTLPHLQIDTVRTHPGSSGSPLLVNRADGLQEIIGVITGGYGGETIKSAVPVEFVHHLIGCVTKGIPANLAQCLIKTSIPSFLDRQRLNGSGGIPNGLSGIPISNVVEIPGEHEAQSDDAQQETDGLRVGDILLAMNRLSIDERGQLQSPDLFSESKIPWQVYCYCQLIGSKVGVNYKRGKDKRKTQVVLQNFFSAYPYHPQHYEPAQDFIAFAEGWCFSQKLVDREVARMKRHASLFKGFNKKVFIVRDIMGTQSGEGRPLFYRCYIDCILRSINGQEIHSYADIVKAIRAADGDKVTLILHRDELTEGDIPVITATLRTDEIMNEWADYFGLPQSTVVKDKMVMSHNVAVELGLAEGAVPLLKHSEPRFLSPRATT